MSKTKKFTVAELQTMFEGYISRQQNTSKDEWYATDRMFAFGVLSEFCKEELNVELNFGKLMGDNDE